MWKFILVRNVTITCTTTKLYLILYGIWKSLHGSILPTPTPLQNSTRLKTQTIKGLRGGREWDGTRGRSRNMDYAPRLTRGSIKHLVKESNNDGEYKHWYTDGQITVKPRCSLPLLLHSIVSCLPTTIFFSSAVSLIFITLCPFYPNVLISCGRFVRSDCIDYAVAG